jgi:hypothetical protein
MRRASFSPPPGLYVRADQTAARLEALERELFEIRILLERIATRLGVRTP